MRRRKGEGAVNRAGGIFHGVVLFLRSRWARHLSISSLFSGFYRLGVVLGRDWSEVVEPRVGLPGFG